MELLILFTLFKNSYPALQTNSQRGLQILNQMYNVKKRFKAPEAKNSQVQNLK